MKKFVYSFTEGTPGDKNLLGGKGANLCEMVQLGLPVPGGFIVTTEACNKYYDDGKKIDPEIEREIFEHVEKLETIAGKKFGDLENPLLVAVRSGSRASMPGMMDTVLNLGLNDKVVEGLAASTGNKRFAYDSYRRFIMMFADVVKGYDKHSFERVLDKYKEEKNVTNDLDLTGDDWEILTNNFKSIYKEQSGTDFPEDPKIQLIEAITAVFRSWDNDRANYYRKMHNIPYSWGTAVNVQEMVYGNRGDTSGTGVAFTRNPATGENELYGEYLMNSQGEDVVAGIRTPEPISKLKDGMPDIYNQFVEIYKNLERHYKDMQDMEFTIEDGKLFILQTRSGKRTAAAALKIASDLVDEGMVTKEEALLMIDPGQLDQLLHPMFDAEELAKSEVVGSGLAASPGAGTGKIYFSAEDVVAATEKGEKTILVRLETSPEDIEGMNACNGILTLRGGMTSHAAVVARGMGRSCVCGAGDLKIDGKKLITENGTIFNEGDYISIDGSTGKVYSGEIKCVEPVIGGYFETIMAWADEVRTLKVRTNADTPKDAETALKFGAEGIGLCRTEHMFFEADRIFNFRKMILADTEEDRRKALDEILPYQREDFESLYRTMAGYPVVIRYLDPPLHEFLPHGDSEIADLAKGLGVEKSTLLEKIESLKEFNPMMGHRGCRLSVTYPEIAIMQTRAVIEAAINVNNEGIKIIPEIMIPLVGEVKELEFVKKHVKETADEIIKNAGVEMEYTVGTMIEIPRACILADEIAASADFFSFGTNDLTQYSFGFSRDDAGKFLEDYYTTKIFESDPFVTLDQKGVGELVKMACEKGRSKKKDLSLGICGEHGGDPLSVEFFHNAGLDYVSCSPFRIPIARLAAAQAKLKE